MPLCERLWPRDNRRKIVTFVRLYQPQHDDNKTRSSAATAKPIVNLMGAKHGLVKSVNTFHYYFHSRNKILFVVDNATQQRALGRK